MIACGGFQRKWIILARNCELLPASEFNCAQFRNNCAQETQLQRPTFLRLCQILFENIQFIPNRTQYMQLIIAQFHLTTLSLKKINLNFGRDIQ